LVIFFNGGPTAVKVYRIKEKILIYYYFFFCNCTILQRAAMLALQALY